MQTNSLMAKLKQVEQLTDKEKSFLQEAEEGPEVPREIPPTLDSTPSNKRRATGKKKPASDSGRRREGKPAVKPSRASKVSTDLDPGVVPYAPSTFNMPARAVKARVMWRASRVFRTRAWPSGSLEPNSECTRPPGPAPSIAS